MIDQSGEYFSNKDEADAARSHWRYHFELARKTSIDRMMTPPFLVEFRGTRVFMATHALLVKSGRLKDHCIVFDQIIPKEQSLCSGDHPTVAEALKKNREIDVMIKSINS